MIEPGVATAELNQICSWSANLLSRQPHDQDIVNFIDNIDDWKHLVNICEEHGLTPAFWQIFKPYSERLPQDIIKTVKVLNLRQNLLYQIQHQALVEIEQAFTQEGIQLALLKGAALRYLIYQNPNERMMFDLDLLIPAQKTESAKRIMQSLGYSMSDKVGSGKHHHLPAAQKTIDNFKIVIELHTEALSYDMQTPISFTHLSAPMREINIESTNYLVLNHIDMLQHLCLHTFARDRIIKLSGIVDIVRYAQHYYDEIDWTLIARQYSYILNTLTLLDCVIERADKLTAIAPPLTSEQKSKIDGVGYGMVPLREARRKDKTLMQKFKDIFVPSQWWTRVYYNVPASRSLLFTRLVRHPYTAIKWILSKNLAD